MRDNIADPGGTISVGSRECGLPLEINVKKDIIHADDIRFGFIFNVHYFWHQNDDSGVVQWI